MEIHERIREMHKPDWLPVFLGVTCSFAAMGVFAIMGMSLGLIKYLAEVTIPQAMMQAAWAIVSVVAALYVGGYITGRTMGVRSRTAAAMNGILVWQMTTVIYAIVSWAGITPLPGVTFDLKNASAASEALTTWIMMLGIPAIFVAIYGAMKGNNHASGGRLPEFEGVLQREEEEMRNRNRRAA